MKILAFGEVMLRLMPSHYKTLIQVNDLEFLFTGTGVNILSGLYNMGDDVTLLTRLPNNSVGRAASANIRKLGICDRYVTYGGNHIGIYVLEQGIGNRPSEVTYLNRKESSFCTSTIDDYDFSCLDGQDVLHICGISLAISDQLRDCVFTLVEEAKARGVKIVFDCNFRPTLWDDEKRNEVKDIYQRMLKLSDIVFAGYKDATLLLEMPVDQNLPFEQQLESLLSTMCEQYNIEAIIGTVRKDESLQGYILKDHQLTFSKEYALTVFDRIGGGDGFAAGAIHAYLHDMPINEMINYATVSGVLAHTTYGDSPMSTKDAILDYMVYGKTDVKR